MRKFLYLLVILLISYNYSYGQVQMQIANVFNTYGMQNDYIISSKVDIYGNMILAGNSEIIHRETARLRDMNFLVLKYNPYGVLIWSKSYDGGVHGVDSVRSMCLDNAGNIYVTGESQDKDFKWNALTIKYSSDGNVLWENRYKENGYSASMGIDIAVDDNFNSYVTGWCDENNSFDCMLLKYDSNGRLVWKRKANGSSNLNDEGWAIDVSKSGKYIYIGGVLDEVDGYHNYALMKYNSDGDLMWQTTYDGSGSGRDYITDIKCDQYENLYATGISEGRGTHFDITTLKLNSHGNILWTQRYNGAGDGDDWANILRLDKDNNVYLVGGIEEKTFYDTLNLEFRNDACLIKYNTNGVFQWIGLYQGPNHYHDCIQWMDFDEEGNIYTCGRTCKNGTWESDDIHTMKFTKDGVRKWVKLFDSKERSSDYGSNIIYNSISKSLFAIGHSYSYETAFDVILIKYTEIRNTYDSKLLLGSNSLSNYPNPFNPTTQIQFVISKDDFVKLNVYDMSGRLIKNLVESYQTAGNHQVNFDGSSLSSGVYFYTLQTSTESISNKFILSK